MKAAFIVLFSFSILAIAAYGQYPNNVVYTTPQGLEYSFGIDRFQYAPLDTFYFKIRFHNGSNDTVLWVFNHCNCNYDLWLTPENSSIPFWTWSSDKGFFPAIAPTRIYPDSTLEFEAESPFYNRFTGTPPEGSYSLYGKFIPDQYNCIPRELSVPVIIANLGVGGRYTPIPEEYICLESCPNPFNAQTVISFYLPVRGAVELSVFDTAGRLVKSLASGDYTRGRHCIAFDGNDLSSGIYIARLRFDGRIVSNKLTLIK